MNRRQPALVIDFTQFKNRSPEKADLADSKGGFPDEEVKEDGEDN